jgi:type I restriction enzyme S subunit
MSTKFVQLSDVCDLQNGYAFKSTDYVEISNTCNIRMSNIRPGGTFNEYHNERYLPDSYAEEYKEYLLKDGDLIIAMTDMATETKILGLPTLVNNTSGRKFLLNQRVGKLCKFSNDIYVPYLRHILTAQDVIEYYKSKGAGGLQINIGKKDILSVKFPLPHIDTQKKIVIKLDSIFSEIEIAKLAAEAKAKNLVSLKESILQKAFIGELVKD